ncbi:hypothetical protein CgunFtcFv8_015214 [Champsocephalus gunnari]|uniref:Uncharacterized protein n=1 Tax=Champsocephalus gunnari TaxID=52237 RepID=A0AAN8C595_CHAGU|nr:hypothetical protein CgunFtcFv8_015214 [Champsocephalus gunnari]
MSTKKLEKIQQRKTTKAKRPIEITWNKTRSSKRHPKGRTTKPLQSRPPVPPTPRHPVPPTPRPPVTPSPRPPVPPVPLTPRPPVTPVTPSPRPPVPPSPRHPVPPSPRPPVPPTLRTRSSSAGRGEHDSLSKIQISKFPPSLSSPRTVVVCVSVLQS